MGRATNDPRRIYLGLLISRVQKDDEIIKEKIREVETV